MSTDLMIGAVAGTLLHEAGHVVASVSQGLRVKRIGVSLKGVYVVRQAGTPLQNAIVAFAGPLVNLILAAILSGDAALANLILAVMNLAPLPGSDGRKILEWR